MALYSFNNSLMVLAVLLNNPTKLLNDKYKLTGTDFEPELFHRIIFWAIRMLLNKGVTDIDEVSIDTFLQDYNEYYEVAKDNNLLEVVSNLKSLANEDTFDYHYDCVKKLSLLRYYHQNKFDISPIWDINDTDDKNHERLNKKSIEEIINIFENVNSKARRDFLVNTEIKETKVGECFREVKERFKQDPMYGASLGSMYLNTIARGWIKGQLCIFASPSGSGKSSYGIKVLSEICVPQIYDLKTKQWIDNKSFKNEAGLYIQFELANEEEAMPKFMSYISKVDTGNIMNGQYNDDEEERVDKAIDIFEENNVFIVNVADFNIATLKSIIQDYVLNHNIQWVVFDYITDNSNLNSELAKANKVQTRSDMVLSNLAKQLKLMARKFNIGILTFVQTNGNEKNLEIIDSSIMSGSYSIKNTSDVSGGFLPLRKKEIDIAKIWEDNQVKRGFDEVIKPNRCFHMFKVRFSSYPQNVKVYVNLNLGTGEMTDCFVTDCFDNFISVERTLL